MTDDKTRPVFKAKHDEPKAPVAPETTDAVDEDYADPADPTMGPSSATNSPRGEF